MKLIPTDLGDSSGFASIFSKSKGFTQRIGSNPIKSIKSSKPEQNIFNPKAKLLLYINC